MAAMTYLSPAGLPPVESPSCVPLPATFEQLAALPDDCIDVAVGAALIARDAYGGLEAASVVERFDALAAPLVSRGLAHLTAAEQAVALSKHLHEQIGFRGNDQDYYDPKNSLLPDVLERKLGIPITLALVYCEVGRRVGVQARGVSFPGHFLVRVDDAAAPASPVMIDPFFGGRRLEKPALQKLLERASPNQTLSDDHLAAASARMMLVRMLINLKWIYATRGDFARALLALDRIISLTPDSVPALRERGLLAARLGAVEAARADLARLLEIVPQLPDASTIRQQLEELRSRVSVLN
ncbi:MAG: transglutaminase-like domain-containing protein [Polyangiaceae bacterium]|nr:transglutaminase-like domain-containing protein [Polyangiaceae bacterium]